jgi:regulatory protein
MPGTADDDTRHSGRSADPVDPGDRPGTDPANSLRPGRRRRAAGPDPVPPGGGTEEQAKEVCLRLLTERARSRAELAEKLAARGFAADIAERALNRLAEVGLVDDAAFAEQWVRSRHTFSGKGKAALTRELRRKGIAPADAESALAAITADDEHDRAADLVRRKLRTLPPDLGRDRAIGRLVGMLARRGYDQSTAYAVVRAELARGGTGDAQPPG